MARHWIPFIPQTGRLAITSAGSAKKPSPPGIFPHVGNEQLRRGLWAGARLDLSDRSIARRAVIVTRA